jgi:hypothetical protein
MISQLEEISGHEETLHTLRKKSASLQAHPRSTGIRLGNFPAGRKQAFALHSTQRYARGAIQED